ncbi:cytochrome c oxidase subunit II [Tepidamorphus sp. 3E244]|uniref:cytochrome c oxidase subunit II n=1 Tax=Tepidamorphus sp. 3E244 TaxID=3385498 RepID=UPI0038FCE48F
MALPVIAAAGPGILLSGCSGPQSVLDPAGKEAGEIASLFWFLAVAAVVLWLLVMGLFVYVTRLKREPHSRNLAEVLIIGGGVVFPVVALAGLLAYALPMMPAHREPGSGLTVTVIGEQWWWRVTYQRDGEDEAIVSANEIRLPRGARTEIVLGANKVIHSFWVPALAGKLDMFPGRTTRMALEPTRSGIFRGQCAEFCGESHALMAFQTVVMEPDEFDAWLERESGDAQEPVSESARRGRDLFLAQGCGGCHAVRGTPARAKIGPDLTHVGGRKSLGAGILPVDTASLARWTQHAEGEKPGAKMPSYDKLSADELSDIAAYLEGLK